MIDGEVTPDAASAFWCFNGMPGDAGVAEAPAQTEASKDIAQLKERLKNTLSDEKKAEQTRRAFAAQQEDQARTATEQQDLYRYGQPAQQQQGQVAWLNDNLRMDQERSQQLGAARGANARGTIYRVEAGDSLGQTAVAGRPSGLPFPSSDATLTPSAGSGGGAGGNEEWSGTYDISGDGRVAQGYLLFSGDGDNGPASDILMPSGGRPALAGIPDGVGSGEAWGRVLIPAQQRAGLMGVDVPLPREGNEHLFASLKGGAPITFTLTRSGWSLGARIALLLVLLGGLAAAGTWWVRRA